MISGQSAFLFLFVVIGSCLAAPPSTEPAEKSYLIKVKPYTKETHNGTTAEYAPLEMNGLSLWNEWMNKPYTAYKYVFEMQKSETELIVQDWLQKGINENFAGSNKRLKNRDHSIDKIYVSLQIIIGKNHIFGAHPPLDATIEIHENKRDFGLRMDLQLTLSEKEQNLFAIFRIDFYPSDLQTDVTPGSYKLVYKK